MIIVPFTQIKKYIFPKSTEEFPFRKQKAEIPEEHIDGD